MEFNSKKRLVINKNVFEHELELCKKLSKENGGKCQWGNCLQCGALPLLYKLYTGIVMEDEKELQKMKKKMFDL